MNTYLVWDPLDYGETAEDAREVKAFDMEEAAEKWAELRHANYEWPDEMRCVVRSSDGVEIAFVVGIELSPTFHAHQVKA